MSLLDLPVYVTLFVFRAAYLLLSLAFTTSSNLYDYWCTPSSDMGMDVLDFIRFFGGNLTCFLILCLHGIVTTIIWLIQLLPLSSVILWWPKFYAALIFDPDGRSILDILRNPRLQGDEDDKLLRKYPLNRPLRSVRRRSNKKNKPPPPPEAPRGGSILRPWLYFAKTKSPSKALPVAHPHARSLSCYTSYGAYANLGKAPDPEARRAIHIASNYLRLRNPFWLGSLFNLVAEHIIPDDLPNTIVTRGMGLTIVVAVYLWTLSGRLLALAIKHFNEEQEHIIKGSLYEWEREEGKTNRTATPQEVVQKHIALASEAKSTSFSSMLFDTDGISFVIDNSATCVICNDKSQFKPGSLHEKPNAVETAAGVTKSSQVGILRLTLTDDGGKTYTYEIPDAIYDPNSPFNILGIPALGDFFGKDDDDPNSSDDDGTFVQSSANRTTLTWDHGKHSRTFTHSDRRLPELVCGTGYGYFHAFTSRVKKAYDDTVHYAFSSAHTIPATPESAFQRAPQVTPSQDSPFTLGEEVLYSDGEGNTSAVIYEGESVNGNHIIRDEHGNRIVTPAPHLKAFEQPDLTNVPRTPLDYCQEIKDISPEELKELVYPRQLSPVQQEFLSWHNRLFHMPFGQMYKLAKLGILPKRFMKCTNMLCISCQFGKAHRRPWRTSSKPGGSIRKWNQKKPGDGTSVDQIVSAQPGLVPQMAGELTSNRIWGATVFVDHVTDYVYCHLMTALTLEETLLAKKAYEKLLAQFGHKAKHYRADNGRFADKGFMESISEANQSIDFCAVGHHGQNGIVENKNKMLTLGARTLLLHGIRMWPQMIDSMFWPFALKAYAEQMNNLRVDENGQTPEAKMAGVSISGLPITNYHTLFCPVFVLDSRLQSAGGLGPPKWEPRCRVGVYCGHSPLHAGNVALVFNPRTGRISPQFHLVFDDEFSTVPYMERGEVPPQWEDLCRNSYESAEDDEVADALQYLSQQRKSTEQDKPIAEAGGYSSDIHTVRLGSAGKRPVGNNPLTDPSP